MAVKTLAPTPTIHQPGPPDVTYKSANFADLPLAILTLAALAMFVSGLVLLLVEVAK